MKNHEDVHKIIDEALDKHISGDLDNDEATVRHNLCRDKISLVGRHLSHKKLTGDPTKLEFFQDH